METRFDVASLGLPAESVDTGTQRLFPDEGKYFSSAALKRRVELLERLRPTLQRVLEDGERVAYVFPARQQPTIMQTLGLGVWFMYLHPVVLVLTDRRVIEILMQPGGRQPAGRVRAFAWGGVQRIRRGMGKFVLRMHGVRQTWGVAQRPDRRFLKTLMPSLERRVAELSRSVPDERAYRWCCPACAASLAPSPATCPSCGTRFRTGTAAAALAWAFPGAGLFYAGRAVLGTLDLLGELMLFVVTVSLLATATDGARVTAALVFGVIFVLLTKLESTHVAGILVRRSLPITESVARTWRRFGWAGATVSVLAVAGALATIGTLPLPDEPQAEAWPALARDLEFDAEGTRDRAEFSGGGEQRSQWSGEVLDEVLVSAQPVGEGFTLATYHDLLLRRLEQEEASPEKVEVVWPQGVEGFSFSLPLQDDEGNPWQELNAIVWDDATPAAHRVFAHVPLEDYPAALEEWQRLLAGARWIDAVDPRDSRPDAGPR